MAELGGVLLKHLRLYRLQSSLLFLLPSFPCSMHKESKLEAQAWKKGWGGNRGRKLKLTLKKKYTAKTSQFLCVISLRNFLYFSSFPLNFCLISPGSCFQWDFPNLHPYHSLIYSNTSLILFSPYLSPPISQGKRKAAFSGWLCLLSSLLAGWLNSLGM